MFFFRLTCIKLSFIMNNFLKQQKIEFYNKTVINSVFFSLLL